MDQAELESRLPPETLKALDRQEENIKSGQRKQEAEKAAFEDQMGEGIERHLGQNMDRHEESTVLGGLTFGPPKGGWCPWKVDQKTVSTSFSLKQ